MNNMELILERHEQQLKALQRDVSDLKEVQAEIRIMNETLVTLATEMKHTNEHIARHDKKLDELDAQYKCLREAGKNIVRNRFLSSFVRSSV